MTPKLYSELVPWYRLLTPVDDYAEEAACYREALVRGASRPVRTLLELGSGAGHNAFHLKRDFRCTLTDLSDEMLSLSRELNPECEHIVGDMRTLRLERTFDAVLVHDAVTYMTTEADLLAAARTAFAHLEPGGAAVFTPDELKETFSEYAEHTSREEGDRALQCVEWGWDPDPDDDTCVTDFAFLLREGRSVTAVHDRHVTGLFSRETWLRILGAAGFEVESARRPIGDGETDEVFLCRRR
jgi:SAM-dependent methyltransferase